LLLILGWIIRLPGCDLKVPGQLIYDLLGFVHSLCCISQLLSLGYV